jgi:two-component system, NarL family, sensor histidine kinase DesK
VSILVVVLIAAQGVLSMLTQGADGPSPAARVIGAVATVATAALFLVAQNWTIRQQPVSRWLLGATLVAGSLGFGTGAWLDAAMVFGLCGLSLTVRQLLIVAPVYSALLVLFMLVQDLHPLVACFYLLTAVAVGVLLFTLTRLAIAVAELIRARETVARLRVEEERHRISRDLHDILGRSLVATSLRLQTALRLLDRDPEGCRTQLTEIAGMVTSGQAELRMLTRGNSVLSFADELDTARELFERLNIEMTMEVDQKHDTLPFDPSDQLAARILRESVTNALKHARPTEVSISRREESGASVLVILNDGTDDNGNREGTGLAALADRVQQLGGTLEAGHLVRNRFRVIARLPQRSTSSSGESSPKDMRHMTGTLT